MMMIIVDMLVWLFVHVHELLSFCCCYSWRCFLTKKYECVSSNVINSLWIILVYHMGFQITAFQSHCAETDVFTSGNQTWQWDISINNSTNGGFNGKIIDKTYMVNVGLPCLISGYLTQVSLDFVSCWLQGLLPATLQQSLSSSPFSELPALQGDINTLFIF